MEKTEWYSWYPGMSEGEHDKLIQYMVSMTTNTPELFHRATVITVHYGQIICWGHLDDEPLLQEVITLLVLNNEENSRNDSIMFTGQDFKLLLTRTELCLSPKFR